MDDIDRLYCIFINLQKNSTIDNFDDFTKIPEEAFKILAQREIQGSAASIDRNDLPSIGINIGNFVFLGAKV